MFEKKNNERVERKRKLGGYRSIGLGIIGNLIAACGYDGPSMNVSMLNKKIEADADSIVVLDVRPKSLFDKGHIASAQNMPIEQFDALKQELTRYDKPIAIVCTCGRRSLEAIRKLKQLGVSAYLVKGGMTEWEKMGFLTVRTQ